MHYLALILVSSITIGSTALVLKQGWLGEETEQVLSSTTDLVQTKSAFSELKKPLHFDPVELQIGQKKFQIEQVGLQADGTLDTPSSWRNVGWYTKSSRPGQIGNVIIDGHYDTDQALPAAFWDLKTISTGDKVVLKDEIGRLFTYKVAEVFYVDIADPDRAKIFDSPVENASELTLVTCGGVWDPSIGTYNRRLVVSAYLEQ